MVHILTYGGRGRGRRRCCRPGLTGGVTDREYRKMRIGEKYSAHLCLISLYIIRVVSVRQVYIVFWVLLYLHGRNHLIDGTMVKIPKKTKLECSLFSLTPPPTFQLHVVYMCFTKPLSKNMAT